ncbi:MAG TPA: hypothetical protein VHK70_08150 [Burkholderiaceae bacterium]|jgi:hypothetical protein|nr:hypothetical protein [Burkholderiaceae bacterium]
MVNGVSGEDVCIVRTHFDARRSQYYSSSHGFVGIPPETALVLGLCKASLYLRNRKFFAYGLRILTYLLGLMINIDTSHKTQA